MAIRCTEMLDFTTASREEIKKVYDAISADIGDDRFFTTKELDILPTVLDVNEQVLSFSSGIMNGDTWLIVLTDHRVLFLDKGMLWGLSQTSIDLDRINNVQGKTGFIFGEIRIVDNSQSHEIRNVWKRTVNPFMTRLRAAMQAKRNGVQLHAPGTGPGETSPSTSQTQPIQEAASPAPFATGSVEAGIARLDRLLRAGAINQQDHDAQKAALR